MHCLPLRIHTGRLWSLIAVLLGLAVGQSFAADAANTTVRSRSSQLLCSPCSIGFGNVAVGKSKAVGIVLRNSGTKRIIISSKTKAAPWVSPRGMTLPFTLAPGKTVHFAFVYRPGDSRIVNGTITYHSNASNGDLVLRFTASGLSAGHLTANPAGQSFGNIQVGKTATNNQTLTNTGASKVTITKIASSGSSFSVSGITAPLTLAPGHSVTFTTAFTPIAVGAASGSIAVTSNATDSNLSISEAGTGTSAGSVSVSPATANFGNVPVGSTKTLSATLEASGASVTIKSATVSSNEFSISGLTLPLTLGASKSVTFQVAFTPNSSGAASASVSFTTSSSAVKESLQGTGTSATQHSVNLAWNASTSQVIGYNVYRSTQSGGPYAAITSSPEASTSYSDTSVQSGTTYYYVVTAVSVSGKESMYSNQATAKVP
jgi:hypothetical protein